MSATDELLKLLKEQEFEHYRHEVPAEEDCVAFYDGNRWHDCWESVDGEVNVTFSMTPQEAIAATVGRGTCHKVLDFDGTAWICSECGEHIGPRRWNFCPKLRKAGGGRMSNFKERNEHFARGMTDAQVSYIEAERAVCDLEAENAELREQMERLIALLRNDCDIDASWDGLRRFWSIELTEGGCLMRDRACKAEAENAKLRELLDFALPIAMYAASTEEGDRIRELMREVAE